MSASTSKKERKRVRDDRARRQWGEQDQEQEREHKHQQEREKERESNQACCTLWHPPSSQSFAAVSGMHQAFDTWMAVSEETCVFEIIIPPAQPSPTKQLAEKTKTWNHQHV